MANEVETDRLLNIRETAKLLGVSAKQVHRLRKSREICPHVMVGGAMRFRLSTLTEWLDQSCPNQKDFLAGKDSEETK